MTKKETEQPSDSLFRAPEAGRGTPGTLDAILKALTNESRKSITWDQLDRFMAEVYAVANDRGAAILLATMVEDALERAIAGVMGLTDSRQREFFSKGGFASEFFAKILLGHGLNIFGAETRVCLDIIRHIRNMFAHAKIPVDFETCSVAQAIAYIKIPALIVPTLSIGISLFDSTTAQDVAAMTNRMKFQKACSNLAHNLTMRSVQSRIEISLDGLSIPIDPIYQIAYAQPLPLP